MFWKRSQGSSFGPGFPIISQTASFHSTCKGDNHHTWHRQSSVIHQWRAGNTLDTVHSIDMLTGRWFWRKCSKPWSQQGDVKADGGKDERWVQSKSWYTLGHWVNINRVKESISAILIQDKTSLYYSDISLIPTTCSIEFMWNEGSGAHFSPGQHRILVGLFSQWSSLKTMNTARN